MSIKRTAARLRALSRSPMGRDMGVFCIFLMISAVLWSIMSLNQEEQCDVRLPLRLSHVPDTVTIISRPPSALSVSLSARGTQLLKLTMGSLPTVDVDFRVYRNRGLIHLSETDLKALCRTALGGSPVLVVSPDSLQISYTSHAGVKMPVSVDYKVSAGPQSTISGRPHLSVDSVEVFSSGGLKRNIESISTEPVRLNDLSSTTTERVRLIAPSGTRVIPDSIDVTFEVEPLIIKTRKVVIEPVGVPEDIKLITFPAQIDVIYMLPMSVYKSSTDPRFRVTADYRTIRHESGSRKIRLRLTDVPKNLLNVHLSTDSAEYIIERL